LISIVPFITPSPTLSLHDALPISLEPLRLERDLGLVGPEGHAVEQLERRRALELHVGLAHELDQELGCKLAVELPAVRTPNVAQDRKSTRLNSSHVSISYAVFCLK